MSLHIQLPPEPEFAELISPQEWRTYAQIIEAAEARQVPIAVGAGWHSQPIRTRAQHQGHRLLHIP